MRWIVVLALVLLGCEAPVTSGVSVTKEIASKERPVADSARSEDGDAQPSERELVSQVLSAVELGQLDRGRRQRTAAHRAQLYSPELREELWNLPEAERDPAGVPFRRWVWNAPVDAEPEVVMVSPGAMVDATVVGLHRISGSEAEWASENDIIGFWHVIRVIHGSEAARSCNREQVRKITECRVGGGETFLSSMRRASRYVMGAVPARRERQRWILNTTMTCDEPEGFPSHRSWTQSSARRDRRSIQRRCMDAAILSFRLVTGEDARVLTTRTTPLTWGGRCERDGGACDDPGACRRGLARIDHLDTSNAFWCRPGSRGCSDWVVRNGQAYSDDLCAGLDIPPSDGVRIPERVLDRLAGGPSLLESPEDVLGPLAAL